MREFKIALAQMRAVQGEPAVNLEKMENMIRMAAAEGAGLICFPELSYTGYFVKKERLCEIAEDTSGIFVQRIRQLSAELKIGVIAGYAEADGGELYNSCILTNRKGDLVGNVRKVHLWKSEKKRFSRGTDFPVFETEFGNIAILICYDLEFPEPARIAALRGAELIFCPAAFSLSARNRWDLDLRAASLYNLLYTAGANFADELCCGRSGAAGPDGLMIAQTNGQDETIVYVPVDLSQIQVMREEVPYFDDLDGDVAAMLESVSRRFTEKNNIK